MDFALNGVVTWLTTVVSSVLSWLSVSFLELMGTSLSTFQQYFPFASTAYSVIQGFSFGLLLLIMLFQLFKNYLGPMSDAENPVFLLIKTCIFMAPVLAAEPIYEWLLGIIGTPYNALMGMSTDAGTMLNQTSWQTITTVVQQSVSPSIAKEAEGVIALGVIFILGWNFLKLVLEAAERYIIIGVLAYLAPLPFSTGASKATNNVFKGWCRMAASQLIMLILNVWSVKMVLASFAAFAVTKGELKGNSGGGVILWSICMLAFLKIAQKLDSYMAQIGMSTAQTGGSLLEEVIVAGQGVKAVMSAAGGVASRAMTGSAAGGALGTIFNASPGVANSLRSMFGGAAGTMGGVAAASAVTGAGFGDAAGDVPSSGIGNGGARPNGSGKGGKGSGSAGAIGGLAQRIAVNRFNSGLRATDAGSSGFAFATNTISNIARGDSKQTGTLSDNINAANPEAQSAGTRAFQHYFSTNHSDANGVSRSNKYTAFGSFGSNGTISNVTMGDGHISGMENGQRFDMYSADKYHTPEGKYTTQAAQDGSSWYKVMTPTNPEGAQANSASAGSAGASGSTGTSGSTGASGSGPSSNAGAAAAAAGAGPSGGAGAGNSYSKGFDAGDAASRSSSASGSSKTASDFSSPEPPATSSGSYGESDYGQSSGFNAAGAASRASGNTGGSQSPDASGKSGGTGSSGGNGYIPKPQQPRKKV